MEIENTSDKENVATNRKFIFPEPKTEIAWYINLFKKMSEKQKYIGAYLDGYFSDKKLEYGLVYFNQLEKATKKAKKKFKQYKKQNLLCNP